MTSPSTTFTTSRNAKGKAHPPHIQFTTCAKSKEPENMILVMIKIDFGPDYNNLELMACLQNIGFYHFPCAPNATIVSQEAHQWHGEFNSFVWSNLAACRCLFWSCCLWLEVEFCSLFLIFLRCLCLGTQIQKNILQYLNAHSQRNYSRILGREMILFHSPQKVWNVKISDKNLVTKDIMLVDIVEIQEMSKMYCDLLSIWGFTGNLLRVQLVMNKENTRSTIFHQSTNARVKDQARASTHNAY